MSRSWHSSAALSVLSIYRGEISLFTLQCLGLPELSYISLALIYSQSRLYCKYIAMQTLRTFQSVRAFCIYKSDVSFSLNKVPLYLDLTLSAVTSQQQHIYTYYSGSFYVLLPHVFMCACVCVCVYVCVCAFQLLIRLNWIFHTEQIVFFAVWCIFFSSYIKIIKYSINIIIAFTKSCQSDIARLDHKLPANQGGIQR